MIRRPSTRPEASQARCLGGFHDSPSRGLGDVYKRQVLGRLGVDLGVRNSENSLVFIGFREHRIFEEDKA